jgi:integrase/recombinase XerD
MLAACQAAVQGMSTALARLERTLAFGGLRTGCEASHSPPEAADLTEVVDRFLDWMRARSYSPATIKNRRCPLRRFVGWCAEQGARHAAAVTDGVLEGYRAAVAQSRKRNGKLRAVSTQRFLPEPVKALFDWLADNRLILTNPASAFDLPTLGRTLPRNILTTGEAERA